MSHWFERAEDELVEQLNNGEITREEFNREMRELREDLRAGAEEVAQNAFDDYMGGW
ncbi:MAG: hypothetical protein AB2748_22415 [Candidatus Thiodiazotropha endolucinida]